MKIGGRLDGHIVQGHVDTTAIYNKIETIEGSWIFSFEYQKIYFRNDCRKRFNNKLMEQVLQL